MGISTAVVLAAGEGIRLRPLTRHRPKPMLPAANRPILEYVFDMLLDAGVDELHVVVGYGRDRVRDHFGSSYRDVPVEYVVQEKQLGSGHAVLRARDDVDESFLVVYGDQIAGAEIVERVADAHERRRGEGILGTMALLSAADASEYGGVRTVDDRVAEIIERPPAERSYKMNAGVYAFEPRLFDYLAASEPEGGELSLTTALTRVITDEDEVVRGVHADGLWMDATFPWDLLTVARALFGNGLVGDGSSVWVHDSATVHESAVLRGPVAVSADCHVGPGAVLGPTACLGRNVAVGANAVVEQSVLDADARVGANTTLADCVTGEAVHVGPGNTVEGGTADVRVDGRVFADRRLGALLADRAVTGGDVSFAPGVLVGPDATIETGVSVSDSVDAGAEVRR